MILSAMDILYVNESEAAAACPKDPSGVLEHLDKSEAKTSFFSVNHNISRSGPCLQRIFVDC